MSKPALGRGLGSLLARNGGENANGVNASEATTPESRAPGGAGASRAGGVSLLLRGRDAVSGGGSITSGRLTSIPQWVVPALYASDAVMLLVAVLWMALGAGSWRWLGIALLLAVGCVQALAATVLSNAPPERPVVTPPEEQTPEAGPERKAHIRVHFVDELPRNRR
jgi:hypothetical protein